MNHRGLCNPIEHVMGRRTFMAGLTAACGGWGLQTGLAQAGLPQQLGVRQKRVLAIFLMGGVSQFETWDPKPGRPTGGPFRAIASSVPGIHLCELLPQTAQRMHHLALVRSINSKEDEHNRAQYLLSTGRKRTAADEYPHLGAVIAKSLAADESGLPPHIHIPGGQGNAAYLGPRFNSMAVDAGAPPPDTTLPESWRDSSGERRHAFRTKLDQRFAEHHRSADTDAFTESFDQAIRLMHQRDAFELAQEGAAVQDRYGPYEFGRHLLLARRLIERGVSFVQVKHTNYDTHFENFDFHIEQLGEFDQSFAALVDDLVDRGLWESTLVLVLSEFGRSPKINHFCGRDHWSKAWSIALGGCGIQPGAVVGKTDADGAEVVDREVESAHLFHTFLRAVGLDSNDHFLVDGRKLPLADPAAGPIQELLS